MGHKLLLLVGVLLSVTLVLFIIIELNTINAVAPNPIPTPNITNTNDPQWIVNHCNIPAVAQAHNLLCTP